MIDIKICGFSQQNDVYPENININTNVEVCEGKTMEFQEEVLVMQNAKCKKKQKNYSYLKGAIENILVSEKLVMVSDTVQPATVH